MSTRKFLTPTSIIWALLHSVIGLLGYIIIKVPAIQSQLGESLSSGIGASLIATGATGLALYVYVWLSEDFRAKLEVITQAGLGTIFDARSTRIRVEYDERVKSGHEIDIIGFGLSQFREDHLGNFALWSQSKKIRILLLHPEYPNPKNAYAKQRDTEEKNPEDRITSDIKMFVESVRGTPGINKDNFEVRYMTALPAINIFRIDHELFWGPYLVGEQSRNTLTILAQKGGFMYDQITEHFERIWNDPALSTNAQ